MARRVQLSVGLVVLGCILFLGCAVLAVFNLMNDLDECPREGTSELRSDPSVLPDELTSLGVVDARYITYDRCSVFGTRGFVTLDPAASERLGARYTWQPADAPPLDDALAAQAPAAPVWQRSDAWEAESSRPGWQRFLRDARSGRVYFDNAYGD